MAASALAKNGACRMLVGLRVPQVGETDRRSGETVAVYARPDVFGAAHPRYLGPGDCPAVDTVGDRLLYGRLVASGTDRVSGSSAVLDHIPNIGTPLRTYRDTLRWAETLDRLADLHLAIVIPEFGTPRTIDTEHALRWLHHEVTDRLNRSLVIEQILHDIDYPAKLFDVPFMSKSYGHRDYIVRDIARSETGWSDGNPTTLHPSHSDRRHRQHRRADRPDHPH